METYQYKPKMKIPMEKFKEFVKKDFDEHDSSGYKFEDIKFEETYSLLYLGNYTVKCGFSCLLGDFTYEDSLNENNTMAMKFGPEYLRYSVGSPYEVNDKYITGSANRDYCSEKDSIKDDFPELKLMKSNYANKAVSNEIIAKCKEFKNQNYEVMNAEISNLKIENESFEFNENCIVKIPCYFATLKNKNAQEKINYWKYEMGPSIVEDFNFKTQTKEAIEQEKQKKISEEKEKENEEFLKKTKILFLIPIALLVLAIVFGALELGTGLVSIPFLLAIGSAIGIGVYRHKNE